jgi:uncharacterized membrane protein
MGSISKYEIFKTTSIAGFAMLHTTGYVALVLFIVSLTHIFLFKQCGKNHLYGDLRTQRQSYIHSLRVIRDLSISLLERQIHISLAEKRLQKRPTVSALK